MLRISLVDQPAKIVIWVLVFLVITLSLALIIRSVRKVSASGGKEARWVRIRAWAIVLGAAAVSGVACFAFEVWPNPYPDEVPWWIFVGVFGAMLALLGVLLLRGKRWAMALLAVVGVVSTYLVANLTYQEHPNVASFFPSHVAEKVTYQEFSTLSRPPERAGEPTGLIVKVPLAGTSSHFDARDAFAYVPPAYWRRGVQLPVLVLLSGSPGSPDNWFNSGDAATIARDYGREHGGVTPLMISVDGTGSTFDDPACSDGPTKKIHTYLAYDVPALIKDKFHVNPDQKTWAIAGLSYGGTCALHVVANAPDSYGMFVDFSGSYEALAGSKKQTIDKIFGGDAARFEQTNPASIFRKAAKDRSPRFRHTEGIFVAGMTDSSAQQAQNKLADLARRASVKVSVTTVPGGHSYGVWRRALRLVLPDIAAHGGITETWSSEHAGER